MLCHYASGYVGYIGYHGFIGLINPLLTIARHPIMLVGLDVALGHLPKFMLGLLLAVTLWVRI